VKTLDKKGGKRQFSDILFPQKAPNLRPASSGHQLLFVLAGVALIAILVFAEAIAVAAAVSFTKEMAGFFAHPETTPIITPPQPAAVSLSIMPYEANRQASSSTSANQSSGATSTPSSTLLNIVKTAATTTASSTETKQKVSKPAEPAPTPKPVPATAQQILDGTAVSLKQRIDSSYWIALRTKLGASSAFDWDLSSAAIGGKSIPKFNVSYSCDPSAIEPDDSSADQNPSFNIRTSYNCAISLTAADGRKASKQFIFQTGPGRLVVTKASGLGIVLKDGENTSGLVFNNQDDQPLIITALTFNVSFTALATSSPLAIRFADPKDESSLIDYRIQDLPPDPLRPYTSSRANISVSMAFNIGPYEQRMILVKALGVHKSLLPSVNPEIAVTVTKVSTDRSDINTTLSSTFVSWSCIANTQTYNPYASTTIDMSQVCTD
jgi:hypothetical protein